MRTNFSVSCIFSTLFSILLIISIFNLIQRAGERKKKPRRWLLLVLVLLLSHCHNCYHHYDCYLFLLMPESAMIILYLIIIEFINHLYTHLHQSYVWFQLEMNSFTLKFIQIEMNTHHFWSYETTTTERKKKRSKKGNIDKESNSFIKLIQVSTRHNHIQDQWRENENNNNRSALTNNCIKWSE